MAKYLSHMEIDHDVFDKLKYYGYLLKNPNTNEIAGNIIKKYIDELIEEQQLKLEK